MKHQQVVVDYFQMFKTSMSCIVLVFFVWIFVKLFQSILLLPRYLQRNHDLIEQSLAKYGFTDEELRAQEQALLEEEANANRTQGDEESENKSDDKAEDKNERAEGQIEKCDGVTAAESTNNESKKTN